MTKNIYVAATNQHIGKTTSTLGLVMAMKNQGINVRYCKPVGQQFIDLGDLKVDKDALLFSKIIGFDLKEEIHSPVILGQGATSAFLDNPSAFNYRERIFQAAKVLSDAHDFVIYEGTGHPGVGSVVGLSNAEVAKMLGASVVMIVEGGIGKTIDRLAMSLCVFQRQRVPIVGVIINKVFPEKIDKVEKYVGGWLKKKNLPLLGVLPYDKSLSNPIMHSIRKAVYGTTILNESHLTNQIDNIIPGSLVANHDFAKEKNSLLVVSSNRLCKAVQRIEMICAQKGIEEFPISGAIITGDGRSPRNMYERLPCKDFFAKHTIPVVTTPLDTYGSVVKISNLEVKINLHTPWKAQRAIDLVEQNVNLKPLYLEDVAS